MENNYSTIKKIKITGLSVGIINILSSVFYVLFYIMLSLVDPFDNQQISTMLRERLVIIGIVLLMSGLLQILLVYYIEIFSIVKYQYLFFAMYTVIIPIILLFGSWPLTVINSFLNFLYGLLIGLLIFKARNNHASEKYYLN